MENTVWDVLVAGGGVSGCMAAMAAAKGGARTLLVEQYGFLGGSLTNAGVGPMMTFHAGARRVIGGLPEALVERLKARGASVGHIEDTTGYASSVTPFDAEALKATLDAMLAECGVTVLFHAYLADVRRAEGDAARDERVAEDASGAVRGNMANGVAAIPRAIESIRVAAQGGLMTLRAREYVDATGDGALAFLAGAPTEQGRHGDGLCQPMTTNMKLDHVDIAALRAEIRRRPENFNIRDLSALSRAPRLSVAGFYEEFARAKQAGALTTRREDVLLFETANENEVIVNTTRVIRLDPTDPWQLSRAEAEGRKQAWELFAFFRAYCRGFENAVFLSTGVQIGVRESRRVLGDLVLTADDLLSSRRFPDPVALGGYPIDIHNPAGENTETTRLQKGQFYAIPLRCLTVRGVPNLLTAGRCVSATHEACAAIRVSPIAMALGQAAGAAAAVRAQTGRSVSEDIYPRVREALLALGAILE